MSGLSAQKRQHALSLAATIAAGRGHGLSTGLLGGTEEEALVCLQALRLVQRMDQIVELVDENPELLKVSKKLADARLQSLMEGLAKEFRLESMKLQWRMEDDALRKELAPQHRDANNDIDYEAVDAAVIETLRSRYPEIADEMMSVSEEEMIAAV